MYKLYETTMICSDPQLGEVCTEKYVFTYLQHLDLDEDFLQMLTINSI